MAENEIGKIFRQETDAIDRCGANKAPGPDGFNIEFFKNSWSLIGTELEEEIRGFFNGLMDIKHVNKAFLTLIPKNDAPQGMHEYRPISLVGGTYKIISKILANRMTIVLDGLISDTQSAFVGGRQLVDGVLIANEIIHTTRRNRMINSKIVMVKLDFAKAYDSVRWEFLSEMMMKMKFPRRFRMWVDQCVWTSRMAVLVNGTSTKFFAMERGLRQGDPISPGLFLIVVEGLHMLLNKEMEIGMISGWKSNDKTIHVTHLQFVDDTMLFLKAETENLKQVQERKHQAMETGYWCNIVDDMVCPKRCYLQ